MFQNTGHDDIPFPFFVNNYFPIFKPKINTRNFLVVVLLTGFIESLYFKNLILYETPNTISDIDYNARKK